MKKLGTRTAFIDEDAAARKWRNCGGVPSFCGIAGTTLEKSSFAISTFIGSGTCISRLSSVSFKKSGTGYSLGGITPSS